MTENKTMTNGDLVKGIFGSVTSLTGAAISFMPAVETGLRIASLSVGLSVGILTLLGLLKKRTGKK